MKTGYKSLGNSLTHCASRLVVLMALASFALATLQRSAHSNELPSSPIPPFLVVDTANGEILAENEPFLRWAPASLTKLMTAYTVFRTMELQHLAMNSPVRISEEAAKRPPSKMGFPVGTIITVETALKIILVKSANDVSLALAEGVGGTEENFVQLMNSHARRLGMYDTQFRNPHGLPDPEQYTSARDMAVLSMALAEEFPQYNDFYDIVWLQVNNRRLRNHNALLRLFPGTSGMKTGYVCASGYNVIVRTKRKGRELLAIVFGGRSGLDRNVRTAELLTAAFKTGVGKSTRTIASVTRPEHAPIVPADITRELCPGKYPEPGFPQKRPAEAPKADDFSAIDTVGFEVPVQPATPETAPIPIPRPEQENTTTVQNNTDTAQPETTAKADAPVSGSKDTGATQSDGVTLEIEEKSPASQPVAVETVAAASAIITYQQPPGTLRQRAAKVFSPRRDLRPIVKLRLGGATGPNPFGIKHTNGGVYVAPPPIPLKRPEKLDSTDTAAYGLSQAADNEPVARSEETEPKAQN